MSFHIGQQVVCVDDKPRKVLPVKVKHGCVYIVEAVFETIWGSEVTLVGLDPSPDHGWYADRFRPVRKTSIEIFTAMLAPTEPERVA